MTAIAQETALFVTAAGIVVAFLALAKTHQIALSLAVLLDFLTAAGLLRLVGPTTWQQLATVALTITVRQLASRGLRAAQAGRGVSITTAHHDPQKRSGLKHAR
jgi:uncharacterized protein YjeT (DUF2065 family)